MEQEVPEKEVAQDHQPDVSVSLYIYMDIEEVGDEIRPL
jgi:hypothetical protein